MYNVAPLAGAAALLHSVRRANSDKSVAGAGAGPDMRVPLSFDAENPAGLSRPPGMATL